MRVLDQFSVGKGLLVLVCIATLTACGSGKPAKYRKKRGCDCPQWNQAPAPEQDGTRAMGECFPTAGRG